MKKIKSDTFLMLAIVFAIITGIFLSLALTQPVVYEKADESASQTNTTLASSTETETEVNSIASPVSYPLNINTASAEELMTIPEVGAYRAYAIIDYREQIGAFSSVEQIMDIYGFGEKVYSSIAGYLTV